MFIGIKKKKISYEKYSKNSSNSQLFIFSFKIITCLLKIKKTLFIFITSLPVISYKKKKTSSAFSIQQLL